LTKGDRDDHLHRLLLRRIAEHLVGLEHWSKLKRCVIRPSGCSFPDWTVFSSIGVVFVFTSPVVSVMFWIHSFWICRFDALAVHADVGDVAARPHDGLADVERGGDADRLDGDIDAVLRRCEDLLGDSALCAVDDFGRAELLRQFETRLVDVDHDEPARGVELRGEQRRHPDRAGADDGDVSPGLTAP
jgi:hypothetical protein